MLQRKISVTLASATLLALGSGLGVLSGCEDDSASPTESGETPSAGEVMEKTEEAGEAAQSFAQSKVDEYTETLKSDLDDVESRLESLEGKAGRLTEEARAEMESVIADLRRQRDALMQRLEAVQVSTQQAWEETKQGLDRAWSELDSALESAVSQFGGGEGSGESGGSGGG